MATYRKRTTQEKLSAVLDGLKGVPSNYYKNIKKMNKFNWKEYIKSRPDLKKNWNGPVRAKLHYYILRRFDNPFITEKFTKKYYLTKSNNIKKEIYEDKNRVDKKYGNDSHRRKKLLVDSFIFFNELDMLSFRLAELDNVVDYFVLVEATHTFSGKPKPLYYNENKDKYVKYKDKIVHIVVTDLMKINLDDYELDNMPRNDCWAREYYQRNCISDGVAQIDLAPTDLLIIGDVDEIPNTSVLAPLKKNNGIKGVYTLEMDLYSYNLTTISDSKCTASKLIDISSFQLPNNIRRSKLTEKTIKRGGWHFSYFGDVEFIVKKVQSFSHQEFNQSKYLNAKHLEDVIQNRKDIFLRKSNSLKFKPLRDNKHLPKHYEMLSNIPSFKHTEILTDEKGGGLR